MNQNEFYQAKENNEDVLIPARFLAKIRGFIFMQADLHEDWLLGNEIVDSARRIKNDS